MPIDPKALKQRQGFSKHIQRASDDLASSLESPEPMALKRIVLFGFICIPLALP
jgi:hypothetical protein